MQPTLLLADADEYSVTRSLDAYLLWLFGYIMFNNPHGNSVDRILLPYAREIREVLANFFRDLMKDKLGALGVSGRDPADDDDDYMLE